MDNWGNFQKLFCQALRIFIGTYIWMEIISSSNARKDWDNSNMKNLICIYKARLCYSHMLENFQKMPKNLCS